jgi:hypothetical protein
MPRWRVRPPTLHLCDDHRGDGDGDVRSVTRRRPCPRSSIPSHHSPLQVPLLHSPRRPPIDLRRDGYHHPTTADGLPRSVRSVWIARHGPRLEGPYARRCVRDSTSPPGRQELRCPRTSHRQGRQGDCVPATRGTTSQDPDGDWVLRGDEGKARSTGLRSDWRSGHCAACNPCQVDTSHSMHYEQYQGEFSPKPCRDRY